MTQPTVKLTGKVAPDQLTNAVMTIMQRCLPLKLQNTRITPATAWQVLAYASVRHQTIQSACDALPGAPSGNRLREVLLPALPPLARLQGQLNRILRLQLHRSLWKKPRGLPLAIDLVCIPYHGQPQAEEDEVMRGKAKSGTTHFHGYATATVVHDKRRYTVAMVMVRLGEALDRVVAKLLDRVKRLKLKLRRVYLDAGFSSIPVLRTLKRRRLAFLLPLPVRGRSGGVRKLFTGRKSYVGTYTLVSQRHGTWTVEAVVVRKYLKGRYGKHGVKWFAYAISELPPSTPPGQIFQWYRRRFGIESTYRQMNRVRARTTSRNPVWRLLLVGLALVLVNLHIALRRVSHLAPDRPNAAEIPLTLIRLAELVQTAIEHVMGSHRVIVIRQSVAFS